MVVRLILYQGVLMSKVLLSFMALTLCGCVDLGRVSLHPETKTVYIDGHKNSVENCLSAAARGQKLYLEKDDPLHGGINRFYLKDTNDENVAWVETARFSHRQTSVDFYYAPHVPEIVGTINTMIAQCQNALE